MTRSCFHSIPTGAGLTSIRVSRCFRPSACSSHLAEQISDRCDFVAYPLTCNPRTGSRSFFQLDKLHHCSYLHRKDCVGCRKWSTTSRSLGDNPSKLFRPWRRTTHKLFQCTFVRPLTLPDHNPFLRTCGKYTASPGPRNYSYCTRKFPPHSPKALHI